MTHKNRESIDEQQEQMTTNECPDCNGSGELHVPTIRQDCDYSKCPNCKGTGRVKIETMTAEKLNKYLKMHWYDYNTEVENVCNLLKIEKIQAEYSKDALKLINQFEKDIQKAVYSDAEADGIIFCGKCGKMK